VPPGFDGVTYGLEVTGTNLVFHDDRIRPDPFSGFRSGRGFGIPVPVPFFETTVDASAIPPGLYQIRVIPLAPGGSFSDPVTLRFGPLDSEQPRFTSPPDRFVAVRDVTPLTIAWTAVPGADGYQIEVSGPPVGVLPLSIRGTTVVGPFQVPGTFPAGVYQLRILPFATNGQVTRFIGRASPAITLEVQ
jgi:hypothetical protein